jgi:methionyl-tRNA formyltransferase
MRSVFFGTPAIAIPALIALKQVSEISAAVCQPDRPSGRGLKTALSPIKQAALELGIPVHQPMKVRTGELAKWLREQAADVVLVMAYGRILPSDVLAAPRRGALNLHASLLPKYRGAAPINWAIVHGETETGISLMQMDEGLDTGPVFSRHAIPVAPDETAETLARRLSELAAHVVREDLPRVMRGDLAAEPQDHARATYAPLIEREHLEVHWAAPALAIERLVRGMSPKPGAFTKVQGKVLRLLRAKVSEVPSQPDTPGRVRVLSRRVLVGTGAGWLELIEAQLEGKRVLPAFDLVNGRSLEEGSQLG